MNPVYRVVELGARAARSGLDPGTSSYAHLKHLGVRDKKHGCSISAQ